MIAKGWRTGSQLLSQQVIPSSGQMTISRRTAFAAPYDFGCPTPTSIAI